MFKDLFLAYSESQHDVNSFTFTVVLLFFSSYYFLSQWGGGGGSLEIVKTREYICTTVYLLVHYIFCTLFRSMYSVYELLELVFEMNIINGHKNRIFIEVHVFPKVKVRGIHSTEY